MAFHPVVLGRISGLSGVSGWVKVHSFTRPIDNILEYSPWYIGEPLTQYRVESAKPHGKTLVARLKSATGQIVTDRDSAAAFVDCDIAVDRNQMPALSGDEYYWCDLIGCAVTNREDVHLGMVTQMLETGAHDVLVLEAERERLVPFVIGSIVDHVDVAAGTIQVDWPQDA